MVFLSTITPPLSMPIAFLKLNNPLDPSCPQFVKAPLDGSLPDGTKRAKKTFFPPVASVPLEKIEWAVLKTPKR